MGKAKHFDNCKERKEVIGTWKTSKNLLALETTPSQKHPSFLALDFDKEFVRDTELRVWACNCAASNKFHNGRIP